MTTSSSLRAIAIAFVAAPLTCLAESTAVQAYIPTEPISKPSTAVLQGTKPVSERDGKSSFSIDLNQLGFFGQLKVAGSDYTAVIFEGTGKEDGRICPYFNLNARDYTIEEIRPDVFQIKTAVTEDELVAVDKSGCVITSAPERRRIKFLQP